MQQTARGGQVLINFQSIHNGGNMRKILKQLLVAMLLVTLVFPLLPISAASSSLSHDEMRLITGGKQAVDCGALAMTAQAFCYLVGGGSTTCSVVYGMAYVACLVTQIL